VIGVVESRISKASIAVFLEDHASGRSYRK
jgi:hypothetical protein